jgi:hypothetical protein
MLSRRTLLISAAVAVTATTVPAVVWTMTRRGPKPPVYTGIIPGVAAGGYDAVAYFAEGAPVEGRKDISLDHAGATWWFATEANRAQFEADPDRYAPRYGGYCAYAVSHNDTAEGDPKAWSIVDGRLYLNASLRIRSKWELDARGNIAKADGFWPGVLIR